MVNKVVKLSTGLFDNAELTFADNETLCIKVMGTMYSNLKYYFNYKNNGKTGNLLLVDNSITIMVKDLNFGILSAKIVAVGNNKVVHEYPLEDLVIQKLGNEKKVIPEFTELKEQVKAEMQAVIDKQTEIDNKFGLVEELKEQVKVLKQMVYALCDIEESD